MTTPDARLKHKPNKKHTLDEVLKSLQDLIRNELLDEQPPQSKRPAPGADETPAGRLAAGTDASGPLPARLDIPQVIESLHELVTEELDAGTEKGDREVALTDLRAEDPAVTLAPGPATEADEIRAPSDETPRCVPPEGLQEELPLFDSPAAGMPAEDEIAALDSPAAPQETVAAQLLAHSDDRAHAGTNELDDPFSSPQALPPLSPDTGQAPAPSEVEPEPSHADGIPVLEDIALPPPGARLPEPGEAHALAVRIIARLNIELRKSGERPLDPRIIQRLELLLREELEKPMQNAK